MSDVSSQKSMEEPNQVFPGNEGPDEKKAEDSWTDVSLNDDSEPNVKKSEEKGTAYILMSLRCQCAS